MPPQCRSVVDMATFTFSAADGGAEIRAESDKRSRP